MPGKELFRFVEFGHKMSKYGHWIYIFEKMMYDAEKGNSYKDTIDTKIAVHVGIT